jgi:cell division protein FtsL
MAARRVAKSRRPLIALVLVGFVLVATGVIARRVFGVRQQREVRSLQRSRDALEAERIRLEAAIREASSRARLQPIAEERLNMHIPKPDQQVLLNRVPRQPSAVDSSRAAPAQKRPDDSF